MPWITSNEEEYPKGTQVEMLVHVDDFHVQAYCPGRSDVVSREFREDEIILTVRTPSVASLRCRQDSYSTLPPGTYVTLAPARSTPSLTFRQSEAE